ncbi:unnamed protein product [Vitrella brassicaformis CCMP3155]|uniref:Uncharacterized protein n=2 Tax=Vitrella brassicaformis TaxID=1169539 RepID=A0A0G4F1B2_VITBC|nr:unnamed protein product [Vitrella brassicaformis CCMP3155]|mmetsp:Transcript_13307/g.31744  ORF Transcript_13307/g.31744 Transcript_13307/m.31744 type:complete len:177 (+) Transcript_13307:65-595(+)|eukprot:CEM05502.1 unnamed protein product [Vitrella brassicaformis CCMP3155]
MAPSIADENPSFAVSTFRTTVGDLGRGWKATSGVRIDQTEIPKMADVMGRKILVKAPLRPQIDTSAFPYLESNERKDKENQADRVSSAHTIPRKFRCTADKIEYPEDSRKGASNPLYATASRDYGKEKPKQHQLPERYFPKSNAFTKGFPVGATRMAGLKTAATRSNVHSALDRFY